MRVRFLIFVMLMALFAAGFSRIANHEEMPRQNETGFMNPSTPAFGS